MTPLERLSLTKAATSSVNVTPEHPVGLVRLTDLALALAVIEAAYQISPLLPPGEKVDGTINCAPVAEFDQAFKALTESTNDGK